MSIRISGAMLAVLVSAAVAGAQSLDVIPRPSEARILAGAFTLRNPVRIVVPKSSPRIREIGELLGTVVRTRTGFSVKVTSDAAPGSIALDATLATAHDEAYTLEVDPGGVAIHGATAAGVLWGVQTLRQLLPPEFDDVSGPRRTAWSIPAVAIHDAPRFAWRGSLVDVGRHFFPVSAVEKHIDALSRYKMNVLHWHLTEDQGWRIEIQKHPRLTSVGAWRTESDGSRYGGFYTQQDIREVVEYARVRGVTVVPEIEMPGHSSAALAAYPDLGCTGQPIAVPTSWGVFADVYCAGNERTFEFLTNVLDEVLALFPSRHIHIGGDEVPKDRWKDCASCQAVMRREGLATETELQSWFVRRIGDYLSRRGRTLIGWDEVLEGGLFPGAIVQVWRDPETIRAATMSGHDVIASPSGWTYLNGSARELPIDRVYAFDPMPTGLEAGAAARVLGGEAALWSEHITSPANLELMAFPRMLALSEALWSAGPRDAESFHARLTGDHLARLRAMGIAAGPMDRDLARITVEYDAVGKAARVRTDVGAPGVVVRATSDGSVPSAMSPVVAASTLLTGEGERRFQPFYGSEPILAERVVTIVRTKATSRQTTVTPAPSQKYPGTGPATLTDGLLGGPDHADGVWQGWLGEDVSAVVDLGEVLPMNAVRMTFLQNVRSWILFPARVEFSVSDEGVAWRSIGASVNHIPPEREGVVIQAFDAVPSIGTRARYVRVVAHNGGPLPVWHPGAGRPSWLFADEIAVR